MTAIQTKHSSAKSSMGLESLGDLAGLLNAAQGQPSDATGPQELLLSLIDEDPNQPRKEDNPGFQADSLEDLATTIRLRGVKSPISVRENPSIEGRYLINHGARRYRASKLAQKETIPAFIDNDYNEADQVIENLQRNELTAREIADFIGRELAKGQKKGDIAKAIGKSPSFVTQHVTLLDLPEPIAEAFNVGRTKDVTVINELTTAYKKNPAEVSVWLADESQELTRGSIKLLREFLDDKRSQEGNDQGIHAKDKAESSAIDEKSLEIKEPKAQDPEKLKKAIIQVRYHERQARIVLNRRPQRAGYAWLKYEDDGQEVEADLAQVQLLALVEG